MSTVQEANTWAKLLERLSADRATLVEDFLARLTSTHLYDGYDLAQEDLRRAATDTIEMLILQIGGVPLPAHLKNLPARLGVRRARQGVAREVLLEAVRLDFRVLWSGLLRANGDRPADILVLHTEDVLSAVERYISEVQAAYLDEQAALNRDSRVEISRAFSRLLAAGDDVATVANEVAAVLRFRADAEFEVISVTVSRRGTCPARHRCRQEWPPLHQLGLRRRHHVRARANLGHKLDDGVQAHPRRPGRNHTGASECPQRHRTRPGNRAAHRRAEPRPFDRS